MGLSTRKYSLIPTQSLTEPKKIFQLFLLRTQKHTTVHKSLQSESSLIRWQKPPYDKIKVNWDAAFVQKEDISRVGVIARNHNGQVIGSLKITRELRGDAFIAEFFAFLQVVNFCIEAGFLNIILEGDTQLVVKELKVANLNWIIGALLLQDAKLLINSIPH